MSWKFGLVINLWLISSALGVEWTDFRVKFSKSLSPVDGFFEMPRTLVELEADTTTIWLPINSDCLSSNEGNNFAGFRYENPIDDGLVLIYDVNGIIAGIQARMPIKDMIPPGNQVRIDRIPLYRNITENDKSYFIFTAYFVLPGLICTTGRTDAELKDEGTARGVWFQKGPTPKDLHFLPRHRSVAIKRGWSKNYCFPGMGFHNFYRVEDYESHNCNEIQPSFGMYYNDRLLGFGFSVTGTTNASKYLEHPATAARRTIIGDPFPECVATKQDLFGSSGIHVYFIPKPWLIQC